MLKPFTWENYDGRPLVILGPFGRAYPVLLACEEKPVGTILLYDPFSEADTYEDLLKQFYRGIEMGKENYPEKIYHRLRKEAKVLSGISVKKVYKGELPRGKDCYPILVGKVGVKNYLRALKITELSDLYFATPILKDGFYKCDYYSYFSSFFRKQKNALYLGSVELVLTPRCNLRCRYCANLMPYYHKPQDVSREILISGLQRFLAAVDGVGMVRLLGGEPLLAQDNLRAILKVFEKPQNRKVMGLQIVTNGSLLFERETLQMIKVNPLVAVYISNYDFLEVPTKALMEQLESWKIPYILCGDSRWQNFGNPSENYGSDEQRITRFRTCKLKESCNTILSGFFYVCPRQAHGAALGIYPPNSEQRVWLMEKDLQKLRKEIYQMHFRKEPVTACFSCKEGDEEWIGRAEQMNKNIK